MEFCQRLSVAECVSNPRVTMDDLSIVSELVANSSCLHKEFAYEGI